MKIYTIMFVTVAGQCADLPCQNGGTCTAEDAAGGNSYRCRCSQGYTGNNCQKGTLKRQKKYIYKYMMLKILHKTLYFLKQVCFNVCVLIRKVRSKCIMGEVLFITVKTLVIFYS